MSAVDAHECKTSETRAEAEARLPDAEARCPSCQACGDETEYEDGVFCCEPCGLTYDRTDLTAAYIDDEAEPCAKPCTASWHKPDSLPPPPSLPAESYLTIRLDDNTASIRPAHVTIQEKP